MKKDTDELKKDKEKEPNESIQDDKQKIDKDNKNEESVNNEKEDEEDLTKKSKEEKEENEEIKEEKEEIDWKDKYTRLLAEFDNYRKRTEKEKASLIGFGSSMVLGKILPIVDNIERALLSIPEDEKKGSIYDGLDKIYKQVLKTFEELDIKPIEALGKKFDPNLHNAVMTDEESSAEPDTITEELQKGYTLQGDVLRHTMVKVKK